MYRTVFSQLGSSRLESSWLESSVSLGPSHGSQGTRGLGCRVQLQRLKRDDVIVRSVKKGVQTRFRRCGMSGGCSLLFAQRYALHGRISTTPSAVESHHLPLKIYHYL